VLAMARIELHVLEPALAAHAARVPPPFSFGKKKPTPTKAVSPIKPPSFSMEKEWEADSIRATADEAHDGRNEGLRSATANEDSDRATAEAVAAEQVAEFAREQSGAAVSCPQKAPASSSSLGRIWSSRRQMVRPPPAGRSTGELLAARAAASGSGVARPNLPSLPRLPPPPRISTQKPIPITIQKPPPPLEVPKANMHLFTREMSAALSSALPVRLGDVAQTSESRTAIRDGCAAVLLGDDGLIAQAQAAADFANLPDLSCMYSKKAKGSRGRMLPLGQHAAALRRVQGKLKAKSFSVKGYSATVSKTGESDSDSEGDMPSHWDSGRRSTSEGGGGRL
jgi:hypothetical protein